MFLNGQWHYVRFIQESIPSSFLSVNECFWMDKRSARIGHLLIYHFVYVPFPAYKFIQVLTPCNTNRRSFVFSNVLILPTKPSENTNKVRIHVDFMLLCRTLPFANPSTLYKSPCCIPEYQHTKITIAIVTISILT